LARPLFRRFASRPDVRLAYVSGRHRALVEDAIAKYDLPKPDFVIGDVGASVYEVRGDTWHPRSDWCEAIAKDWAGYGHDELAALLAALPDVRLQEASKQAPHKLSYYAEPLADPSVLLARVRRELAQIAVRINLIWSIDETTHTGLLDILPASASKLHALEFLRTSLGIPLARTVFAGDSGNDMDVLTSNIPSVLVANAQDTVRNEALALTTARGHASSLYLAQGGLAEMNGNYSAGILEGVAYFIPATRIWLEA
jgi:HAD superfamily hydrolase (TIGR01484 family)